MKARWTMVAALVAVVVAALALAGAASAQSRYTHHVLHLDETYVDPHWSSTCGFDVVEHDEGVLVFYWNIVGKRVILDQV